MTAVPALAAELNALVRRVRPWPTTRWMRDANGDSNADAAYRLVLDLVALTRRVAPEAIGADAVPPRLGDHALADQLAVVGAGFVGACHGTTAPDAPDVVEGARRLVREAGRQLS